MHDPMTVAFEIRRPWPERQKGMRPPKQRWSFRYQWARWYVPWEGWTPFPVIAGRRYYLPAMVTIWHVEPHGHDSGTVCRYWRVNRRGERVSSRRWAWHAWHWKIQIHFEQKLRRFLFERCVECGHRYPWGYSPVSHQWDGPSSQWFKITKTNYHFQCSSLVNLRRTSARQNELIRQLAGEIIGRTGEDERSLIDRWESGMRPGSEHYWDLIGLRTALGWRYDSDTHALVKDSVE